jgi:hypothetical protein
LIVITTNYHPDSWYDYSGREESRLALYRRITKVMLFEKDVPPKEVERMQWLLKEVITVEESEVVEGIRAVSIDKLMFDKFGMK